MIGKDDTQTLRFEAIIDLDTWIWHFYFGLLEVMNDLNVLWTSPFFSDVFSGTFPDHEPSYTISGEQFTW